jgi:hypothetical protein|tara:strand:+ start:535 stop:1131 length:597 start_codon:yes stop_codon:yes gene_type:complete
MDYSDLVQTVIEVGAPDRIIRKTDAEHERDKKEREREIELKKKELEKAKLQAKIERERKKAERDKAKAGQATSVSKDYRGDMKDSVEEALTTAQRLKRGRVMKQKSKIIQRKKEISLRKRATPEKLQKRAMKKARDILKKKITAGKDMKDVGFGQRQQIEKQLEKKKAIIKKIAKKLMPVVRKAENERIKHMRGGDKE